jgi:putative FmdB family regulatory protein
MPEAKEASGSAPESKGGSDMPVYEYYCDSCRRTVAVTLSMSQHGKIVPACPQCGGKGLQAVVSTFFSQTSRKS